MSVDPFGWDEPAPTRLPDLDPPAAPLAAREPTPGRSDALDPRFTSERAQELLDHDRAAERRLVWRQVLALLVVLAIVAARATIVA